MKRISVQSRSVRYDSGLEDETDISSILKSAVISVLEDETGISSIHESFVGHLCVPVAGDKRHRTSYRNSDRHFSERGQRNLFQHRLCAGNQHKGGHRCEDALANHKPLKGFNMGLKEKLLQFRGTEPVKVDWEIEKEKWLVSVRVLYDRIHTWLNDLVNEKLLKITESEIMVVEEEIGRYMVPKLEIDFVGRCAILEPVATNLAQCDGRADFFLRGENSKGYMLLLLREYGVDNWIRVGRVARGESVPFDKETMESTLEKWIEQQFVVRKKMPRF